ncbi:MAG: MFS transporter, partial [Chitinophagaceae bacterium]|nr:MFS transporter [Chitinophagaceae bacterium]
DFMIMMPLGNYLMPYFHISPGQFSFLVGAYTLSAAFSGFAAAFFVDRFDRRKILLLGYGGFLLGTIACGIAPSYMLLFAARVFAGIFGGLIGAQVLSIISDLFAYEQRGKAMGSVMSAFAIASTIGVPFSLYLANLISWHAPFILVGILGIVIIPLVMKFVPPMTEHVRQRSENESRFHVLLKVIDEPKQRLALLFSALMMAGHFMIIPFVNPYMEFNMGYSKSQTPMIYLVGGIASFLSANILGRLADKYGKLIVFTVSVILSLFLVYTITNLPVMPFYLVLALFALWFVFSTGRGVAAQAMVTNVVLPEQRGSFMSFNSSVQQLGTSIASFVAGMVVIKDGAGKIHHYSWLGYLSIIILFACMMLARYLFNGLDKKVEVQPQV